MSSKTVIYIAYSYRKCPDFGASLKLITRFTSNWLFFWRFIIIVFNKTDLLNPQNEEIYLYSKEVYKKLGYKTISISTITGDGVEELKAILKDKISSFNGRSGVGKSSLIKSLDPAYNDIRIGEISKKYDRGTHTTTHSKIYSMSFGGMLADTPGIREFSIFIDKPEDLQFYFRDFDKYRGKCRFPNCQHIDEPDCKVLDALEKKKIDCFRYESYLRMRETVVKLKDSRI